MKEKRQRLIDVFMPTPVGWILIAAIIVFLLANPYHVIDRVFDLAHKGTGYSLTISIAVFVICLPYSQDEGSTLQFPVYKKCGENRYPNLTIGPARKPDRSTAGPLDYK
jgi:hypothetical protein